MNAQNIKSEIIEILDHIENEKLIEVYRDILLNLLKINDTTIVGYTPTGEALTTDTLKKEVTLAQSRVKTGKYITHEKVKNKK